ncbi:hypothetical protein SBRCBS47491_004869 [Sporothrix bragantina]|uniref:Uncharacterized protein n=1 Tax=Sporothrix bragantina TaxID=671064 RepID=A0ABP0BSQ3_9PEZI
MPLLVRAEAHPGFRDVSFLYVATGSRPWMRSLFASLAALHLGQGTPSHQAVADRYYYTALAAYKVILEKGEAQGTEDWLLSAAVFFYLYEQWRSGVASNIRQHLEGTAQLLRLRRTNRRAVRQQAIASTPVSTLSAMDRIAAESFLYHVAIDSIVDPDLDTLSSKFSWADVNEGLGYNPFPSASEAANSPVLGHGGAPSVYRLAFEVTRLGRHWPLVLYDRLEAVQLHKTLSELKTVTLIDDDPEAASPTVRLYLLAIEIYLLKLLDGSEDSDSNIHGGVFVTSSDLYVQHLAQAAMSIIRDEFCTHNEDDYGCLASSTDLCWPMVVLVCTIEAEVDIQLLKECLIALWRTSYCGYVRRIALVVERVWTWRTWPWMGTWTEPWMEPWVGSWQLPGMENECIRDGLCLLTQQGGLARFLNVV